MPKAMSTLIRFRLKMHIFLSALAFCPHWGFLKRFPKWINLKTPFSRCSVDCENGGLWKRWCMFSHVTHIVPIDIYAYTGNFTCYVLLTFTLLLKIFTLFTLHITVLKRWEKIDSQLLSCGKTWGQLLFQIKHDWAQRGCISKWDISIKNILPEELYEDVLCLFYLYHLSELVWLLWGFTQAQQVEFKVIWRFCVDEKLLENAWKR